jgi:hypothetical protein
LSRYFLGRKNFLRRFRLLCLAFLEKIIIIKSSLPNYFEFKGDETVRKIWFVIFFVLFIPFVTADTNLTCEYTISDYYTQWQNVFYETGERLDYVALNSLVTPGKSSTPTHDTSYKVFNNYPNEINVTISFSLDGQQQTNIVLISSGGYAEGAYHFSSVVDPNSFRYDIHNPVDLSSQWEEIDVFNGTYCRQCLGVYCLNNGVPCGSPAECGGGFCVEGYCSNSEVCFNNDCHCSGGEVQCLNNRQCVPRGVVPVDSRPLCHNNLECNTSYIDPTTGLCAKSPTQLEEEEYAQQMAEEALRIEKERNRGIIAGVFMTLSIIWFIVWFFSKKKLAESNMDTIKLNLEKLEREHTNILEELKLKKEFQSSITKTINLVEKDLDRLNGLKNKSKKEKEKVIHLNNDLREELKKKQKILGEKQSLLGEEQELKKQFEKERLKLYRNKQGYMVHRSKEGYEVFHKGEKPFHRWWFKHKHNRPIKKDHEIHHKDFNKLNNDIDNLEELTWGEHRKKHNGRYK